MPSPSLLERIPPPAVYRRIPLDPRLNALGPWHEAVARFVTPDDEKGNWSGLVHATQMSALRILPAHAEFVREVLRQNAECLEALDRGLERGQLQFGELRSLEQVSAETDFVFRLGEVARLHLVRFRKRDPGQGLKHEE